MNKVIVGFSANLEVRFFTDGRLKENGEKTHVSDIIHGIGGTSVNTALQLREFGVPVHAVLTVARDLHLAPLKTLLHQERLPHTLIECREKNSFAVIPINANNGSHIESYKGHYGRIPVDEVAGIVDREKPSALVITGCVPQEAELIDRMFRTQDCLRVLNPRLNFCANREVFTKVLGNTDLLCLNEAEFRTWTGTLEELHKAGPKIIVITRDRFGVVVSDKRNFMSQIKLGAVKLGQRCDTTGAGDVFLASFLAKYLEGVPIKECAKFGALVAGIRVASKTFATNVVTLSEVNKYLKVKEDV